MIHCPNKSRMQIVAKSRKPQPGVIQRESERMGSAVWEDIQKLPFNLLNTHSVQVFGFIVLFLNILRVFLVCNAAYTLILL